MKERPAVPSELFMDLLCQSGVMISQCDLCGRTHFASGERTGDYAEGELEAMRKKADTEPDRFVEHTDEDSLALGFLSGRRVIWGCSCNKARDYEDFILANEDFIIRFLKARNEEAVRKSKESLKLMGEAQG